MSEKQIKLDPDLTIRTTEQHNEYITSLENKYATSTVLSILIATTKDRRVMFNNLCQEFNKQIEQYGYAGSGKEEWYVQVLDNEGKPAMAKASYRHKGEVEIVFEEDEKEMSIGAKRQKLLERAKGKYIVFFDSDDFPKIDYIKQVMKAVESGPDCVGFKIEYTTNGQNNRTCIHSLKYKTWYQKGNIFYRNVTHFNPVLKELALQAGFKDLRFGEDQEYANRVTPLCKTEVFIDEYLFEYRYTNTVPHNEKYGIK